MTNNNYCIVLTTFAKPDEAKPLIDDLLKKGLAACVQCFPIHSYYTWKGKVENNDEVMLFIKTANNRYQEVEKEIKDHHPYETPEIIQIPITTGSQEYLAWINDNTVKSNHC